MTDYTKISKSDWLSLARTFYAHLFAELEGFSETAWHSATRYLGWNCKDLVNHMTSAVTVNFKTLIQMALDGAPVPHLGFNLFLRNADEVARRKNKSVPETLDEFKRETNQILQELEALSEEQWLMPAFFFIGDIDIRMLFLVQFADNLVHERDLLMANKRWQGFDARFVDPLLDWFMRVFHPASFRPEKNGGEAATIQYHITGTGGGNWFLAIKNYTGEVTPGTTENADATVTVSVEDLISTSLARSAPVIGKLARTLDILVKKEKKEDFTAKITGMVASITALLGGKIKITGNKKKANKVTMKWFWHFWQRTEQTQENIMRSQYHRR